MEFYEKLIKIGVIDKNIGILEEKLKVISVEEAQYSLRKGVIRARDIVGITRIADEGVIWADVLNDLFHKEHWFQENRIDRIGDILQIPNDENYPSVVEKDNEYYIDGDGLHRLVIAKLLGIENIVVLIKTYNEN